MLGVDYVSIGCVPSGEECEQLGPNYNPQRAMAECQAFVGQLRRKFGVEPAGAALRITRNEHDFGVYREVACRYHTENEEAANYAYRCEEEMPEWWDEEANVELGLVVNRD